MAKVDANGDWGMENGEFPGIYHNLSLNLSLSLNLNLNLSQYPNRSIPATTNQQPGTPASFQFPYLAYMEIIKAEYLISSPTVDKCPKADRAEYAFIGRSNVGKSSLINLITNKKELAKVSSSPGKTQLINHFNIISSDKKQWYLVDLPGYGYAKRSQSQRKEWQRMIGAYIRKRETLVNLFVLIDSRHEPQDLDLQFVNQLGEWQVPFALVFTKADKTTQKETARHVNEFLNALLETWEAAPPHFVTSAVKRTGVKPLLNYISELNNAFEAHKKDMV